MTRRVHPLFIVMSSISIIRSLLIPFAALILNAIRKGEINTYTWIGISVGIVFVLLYGIASWYFYTFTIDARRFGSAKGFSKKVNGRHNVKGSSRSASSKMSSNDCCVLRR